MFMFERFFSEDNRTEWNTKLFDFVRDRGEATIEDYFGIWTRLVKEYGHSELMEPRRPGHPFSYRQLTRRGDVYYPSILLYDDVPLYHRTVLHTVLPIHFLCPMAEALGATLGAEDGGWIAPRSNRLFWETCLVLCVLQYETYIIPEVMTDPYSREALVMLNGVDEIYFME